MCLFFYVNCILYVWGRVKYEFIEDVVRCLFLIFWFLGILLDLV